MESLCYACRLLRVMRRFCPEVRFVLVKMVEKKNHTVQGLADLVQISERRNVGSGAAAEQYAAPHCMQPWKSKGGMT